MIPYARAIGSALVLALLAASHLWAYRQGGASARVDLAEYRVEVARQATKLAELARDAANKARAVEKAHAEQLAQVARDYEQQRLEDQREQETLVAGLRDGTVRLRNLWQGCQATARVSGAAASTAVADATDRLREASAGRIVGAVRACQTQRDALIDVVEADRR